MPSPYATETPGIAHRTPVRRWVLAAALVFVLVVMGLFFWRGVYKPAPVTDAEARALFLELQEAAGTPNDSVCDLAVFDEKCSRMLANHMGGPVPLSVPSLVCTWPVADESGSRVLEVEGMLSNADTYRASISVSRDLGELKVWPAPYWLYPTRAVPDAGAAENVPDAFPKEVSTDISFDPCLIPGATVS